MGKIILQFFVVVVLFTLVSCGEGSEAVYLDNAKHEPHADEAEMLEETPKETEIPLHEPKGIVEIYTFDNEAEELEELAYVLARHSWAEAYFDALNTGWFPSLIQLIDIDFDGVPEIFFVHHGAAANMRIVGGLSYQNGKVIDIEFYGEWGRIPSEFSFLRDRRTDEEFWLASGRFTRQAGAYESWVYKFVDFSDLSQVRRHQIFAFNNEWFLDEDDTYGIGSIHFLHLPNGEVIEVPFEEIEAQREKVFGDFEMTEVQVLLTHYSHVLDNAVDWQNRTLSRNKLISFFNEWG